MLFSFSALLFIVDQESPTAQIIAQGGQISNVSINQSAITNVWSAIYGEFDEFSGIDNYVILPSVVLQKNFTSYGYDSSMVIIASADTFDVDDIVQAPPLLVDAYLGVGSTYPESGTNTFDTLYNISIGNKTVELYGTQTISVNGTFITLFHNESLSDYLRWKGWKKLYDSMIKIATS